MVKLEGVRVVRPGLGEDTHELAMTGDTVRVVVAATLTVDDGAKFNYNISIWDVLNFVVGIAAGGAVKTKGSRSDGGGCSRKQSGIFACLQRSRPRTKQRGLFVTRQTSAFV